MFEFLCDAFCIIFIIVFKWFVICFVFLSDRTCTVLNVEGDAFGAGLLQFFVDRTAKREEGTELSEVRMEGEPSAAAPEHSPLIEKPDGGGFEKRPLPSDKESAM